EEIALATETSAIKVKMTRSGPWLTGDRAFRGLVYGSALLLVFIIVAMIYEVGQTAWPALTKYGPGFLTGTTCDPVKEIYGALPVIYGTLASATIAMFF